MQGRLSSPIVIPWFSILVLHCCRNMTRSNRGAGTTSDGSAASKTGDEMPGHGFVRGPRGGRWSDRKPRMTSVK